MKYFYSVSFFCLLFSCSYSQRICGTYEYAQTQRGTSPANKDQGARMNRIGRDTVKDETIFIPVVIHILYNNNIQNISDQQVLSQLSVLNNDYSKTNADITNVPAAFARLAADVKIKFCIARTDPQGRSTKGIIRKYTRVTSWQANDAVKFSLSDGDDAWDAKRYLNIWVCNLSGNNLGYSSVPGSSPDKDGLVIQYDVFGTRGIVRYPFDKGRTATHEIGHWLGLMHLWGDAVCGDDHIEDTPPQQSYNNGCPSFPHISNCSINSNGDMFMDFMDFTNDVCMNMFTIMQKNKMRSLFAAGGSRNSFLNSMVCDSSIAENAPMAVNVDVVADIVSTKRLISVYPNPATHFVIIESNDGTNLIGKSAKIFNVLGREIKTQILSSYKNIISVNNLVPGIYFIKIEGEKNATFKFIKQ